MDFHFDLRWRFGPGAGEEVEPELFQLLQGIQEGGSLQVAARERGISYRHAWGLMQKWERLLGQRLAWLERGRGARLTPLGEKLLWGQRRAGARLGPELESLACELGSEIRGALAAEKTQPLRVFASHGLAVVVLRDLINAKTAVRLNLQFRGSLDSLRLLGGSKCELAGFHLPEGPLGARLAPRYLRWLDPEHHRLIHVVRRRQGIMTAADNPKEVGSIVDLAAREARFVNRQPGSGTRLIFDLLLEEAAISPEQIAGYNTEEFTHMAVAALVASGAADAGFGIQAAASQFGLRFVPIAEENYVFALRREALVNPAVLQLVEVLRSREFSERVGVLPGDDPAGAGMIKPIEEIIPTRP